MIPALNAEARLAACLGALVSPTMDGLIREVIIADGGSSDGTVRIAQGFGAEVLDAARGRGRQLRAGAAAARAPWLLFLHADTVLEDGWGEEARALIETGERVAGVFRLDFDTDDWRARLVAMGANWRTRWLKAPYGDQGLIVSRAAFDASGGYSDAPLFEDVDLIDRLVAANGAGALRVFRSKAVTSAGRYERDGYGARVAGNFLLLLRYRLGAAPEALARNYR